MTRAFFIVSHLHTGRDAIRESYTIVFYCCPVKKDKSYILYKYNKLHLFYEKGLVI